MSKSPKKNNEKLVREYNKKYYNQLVETQSWFLLNGYNEIVLKADTISIPLTKKDKPLDVIKFLKSIEQKRS